jgi:hypothetical protein
MRWLKYAMVLALAATGCGDDGSPAASGGLITGENAVIAALEDGCTDGDFVMCDVLYFASPFDSALETFADTCGNRNEGGLYCAEAFGVNIDFGDLTTDCRAGLMIACDQLFMYSAEGSIDEDLGRSCGGIGRESRTCVVDHGLRLP